MNDHFDSATRAIDVISIGVVVGTVAEVLPAIAAAFTIIWTAIRIFETKTVQRLLGRHSSD